MEMRIADVEELHSLDIDIPESVGEMLKIKANTMEPLKEWLKFKENANPRNIKNNVFSREIISKEKLRSMFWGYLSSETVSSEKKVNILWVRTTESRSSVEAELKSLENSPYFKESQKYFKIKSINIIIEP